LLSILVEDGFGVADDSLPDPHRVDLAGNSLAHQRGLADAETAGGFALVERSV
jgi:hypothetical protein